MKKYIEPEINVSLFAKENIVTLSATQSWSEAVENALVQVIDIKEETLSSAISFQQ